nr:MAG TPA: hypothetical protein [Caudoviricetes sp.]DAQ10695.1 MAG TPA: hypothetical protein [Caudoviricetes sp.]
MMQSPTSKAVPDQLSVFLYLYQIPNSLLIALSFNRFSSLRGCGYRQRPGASFERRTPPPIQVAFNP